MRAIPALALLAFAPAALANDLPLRQVYGDGPGCALAQRIGHNAEGVGMAIGRDLVIYKREQCAITSADTNTEGAGWRLRITCAGGQPASRPASISVVQEENGQAVRVTLFSGDGPSGRLPICPTP
jgi:hypothetical protein